MKRKSGMKTLFFSTCIALSVSGAGSFAAYASFPVYAGQNEAAEEIKDIKENDPLSEDAEAADIIKDAEAADIPKDVETSDITDDGEAADLPEQQESITDLVPDNPAAPNDSGQAQPDDVPGSSGVAAVGQSSDLKAEDNGWMYENGSYYYLNNGNLYTGWHYMSSAEGEVKPHWSFFGEDGRLRTGWVQLGKGSANPDGNTAKHWSYFGDNGWLRTGWVQLGKGSANPDGNASKHWSYFGDNGWLRTGWVQLGKGSANPDGNTAKHWSYFGDNGWLRTGWVQLGKGSANPDGNTAKHWSYFGENGWLRTGWQDMGKGTSNPDGNAPKHKSYFGDNGWLHTGLHRIGGVAYSFDSKGWLIYQDQEMLNKAQGYSSRTGYLILVNRSKCKTAIFKGSYGNWIYDKYWSCCVGAPSTPTITGIYYLGIKAPYFDTGYNERCWYKSQISGSYLFHSVIYKRDSGPYTIYDGTMGAWVSHGCVRLDIQNAKYIYDVIPSGTTIVIYN